MMAQGHFLCIVLPEGVVSLFLCLFLCCCCGGGFCFCFVILRFHKKVLLGDTRSNHACILK